MKAGKNNWMFRGHEEFVETGSGNQNAIDKNKEADEKPDGESFFLCVHCCSYQNTTFKITKMTATTHAQKMGRWCNGKWPSEGISVQP